MTTQSRLRITDIKLHRLRTIEYVGEMEPAWDLGGKMHFSRGGGTVVEIFTDGGVNGIGPGVHPEIVEAAKAHLIGQDPFDTEQHVATLRYYASGQPYRGAAGIDIALWDIIGKACEQPLYKLWGGGKDKVPAYASMVRLSTPDERAALAVRLADEGWQAMKLRIHYPTMAEDVRLVEAVCDAVGDRMKIMVDANQAQSSGNWQPGIRWDFRRALETAIELDRLGVYWLEEPLWRTDYRGMAELRQRAKVRIAGGEGNRDYSELRECLYHRALDVYQADVVWSTGILRARQLAQEVQAAGAIYSPHTWGDGLVLLANLQVAAAVSTAPFIEFPYDPPEWTPARRDYILPTTIEAEADGWVTLPAAPGLGVEIDWAGLEQWRIGTGTMEG